MSKNLQKVTNIKVVCRSKTIRMNTARIDQLVMYVNLSVGTVITGEQNGKKVRFEHISGKGFCWIED